MPNGQKATKVSSIAKNHSGIKIEAPSSQPKCVVQVSFVVSNSQKKLHLQNGFQTLQNFGPSKSDVVKLFIC